MLYYFYFYFIFRVIFKGGDDNKEDLYIFVGYIKFDKI